MHVLRPRRQPGLHVTSGSGEGTSIRDDVTADAGRAQTVEAGRVSRTARGEEAASADADKRVQRSVGKRPREQRASGRENWRGQRPAGRFGGQVHSPTLAPTGQEGPCRRLASAAMLRVQRACSGRREGGLRTKAREPFLLRRPRTSAEG